MPDISKVLLTICGFLLFLAAGYLFFSLIVINGVLGGPRYTHVDQIENFKHKEAEIFAARDYFKHTLKVEAEFFIEFDGKTVDDFRLVINGQRQFCRGEKVTPEIIDSFLYQINWTHNELSSLRKKLEAADCISIDNWNDVRLGWQRSGMGKFYYLLLEKPILTPYRGRNRSCAYINYRPDVILEYGGGAFGSGCFPGRSRQD